MKQEEKQYEIELTQEELESSFGGLLAVYSDMSIEEFAPMLRGLIGLYAEVQGCSIGKVLDAILLGKYHDDDPYIEIEQDSRITS